MSDITRQNASFKYALSEATKLDEDSLKRAKDKIGETEANRSHCLHVLRTNLREFEDIEPCLDENFLLKFLRVAKFDCKKAFDRIKNYYRLQDILLNRLKNGSMPITKVREIPYSFLLPYRNENNAVIVVAKMGLLDYSKLSFEKMSYLDWLLTDYLLANPITQLYGVITIFDFADFKFRSALAVNPKTAFEYMYTVQNAVPLRIKGFHVINAPFVFRLFYNMFYPVMSTKLQNRLVIHPNNDSWKSLHSFIPPEILPEEYGGAVKQSDLINLVENADSLDEQFREQFKYGYAKTKHIRMLKKIITSENETPDSEKKSSAKT